MFSSDSLMEEMDPNLRFLVAKPSWETGLLSRKRERIRWGTEGSNPSPSSGESSSRASAREGPAVRISFPFGAESHKLDHRDQASRCGVSLVASDEAYVWHEKSIRGKSSVSRY